MFIEKLILNNYRNYSYSEFNFSSGMNVLTGGNAQGKTNCAEAIFYLCTGYSPKATKDKQVIKYGEKSATIKGVANASYGQVTVEITFNEKGKKDIKVNGAKIAKMGEFIGNINAVFFNPSELKLIQESPEDRRRFMDISLSQMSKSYFYALQKYNNVLTQRNNLLKNQDKEVIFETLPFWDIKLCEYASKIIVERQKFIQKLLPICKEKHSILTNGREDVEVTLESAFLGSEEEIYNALLLELKSRYEKDIILGYTTIGPHRDDLKIKINGEDVKIYGSQGQQRTCALSLKLAELEIFYQTFNEYPLLILDDAFSELDKDRRRQLIKVTKGIQTIITCTELTDEMLADQDIKIFNINDGRIINE